MKFRVTATLLLLNQDIRKPLVHSTVSLIRLGSASLQESHGPNFDEIRAFKGAYKELISLQDSHGRLVKTNVNVRLGTG
jgi:hypothetical protein